MSRDFKKINLISLDVFTTNITNIDNDLIAREIDEYSGALPYIKDPSPAHTFYEDRHYPFSMPECSKLIDELRTAVNSIIGKEMELDSIWTLTLEHGQSVAGHTHRVNTHLHPNDYFSISYYVNAPDGSADLIFLTNHCNLIENSYAISTKTGMLVIFNSYIHHMTNRHYGEEKRIVVSANFKPKNENMTAVPDWSEYSINGPSAIKIR
jgi:hypothetical protein